MAIYTNEHLTDLLNEQYEKVRELEKELQATREKLKEEIGKASDLTCKNSYLEHMLPKLNEIKIVYIKEPMPQCFRCGYVRKEFEIDFKQKDEEK